MIKIVMSIVILYLEIIGAIKHILIIFFEYPYGLLNFSPVVYIICLPYLLSRICLLNFESFNFSSARIMMM